MDAPAVTALVPPREYRSPNGKWTRHQVSVPLTSCAKIADFDLHIVQRADSIGELVVGDVEPTASAGVVGLPVAEETTELAHLEYRARYSESSSFRTVFSELM
jgi:hypothetical protein